MTSKTAKLVLSKKDGKLYQKDSGLVFNSVKEKLVIGRFEGDEFVSLDDKALELCEQFGFKYDESLVETQETEEVGEEVEETEEVEEKAPPKEASPPKKASKKVPPKDASPKKAPPKESSPVEEASPPKKTSKKAPPQEESEVRAEAVPEPTKKTEVDPLQRLLGTFSTELHTLFLSQKPTTSEDPGRIASLEKEIETLKQEIAKKDKKIRALIDN